MSNEFKRTDRVAQMILRKLAQIIQLEVKDPRLPPFVTVSAVVVSKDMAHAKVYVTALGDDVDMKQVLEILNNAASYLRTVLARSIKLRTVPALNFVYDKSIAYGSELSKLIDELNPEDKDESED